MKTWKFLLYFMLIVSLAIGFGAVTVKAQDPAPTTESTAEPTVEPTTEPTTEPTVEPTVEPTTEPTAEPTVEPTTEPTAEPTVEPTTEPTTAPTVEPTVEPTTEPTTEPTAEPTVEPTTEPTVEPTGELSTEEEDIGAQGASGTWTSMFQLINTSLTESTDVGVKFYTEGIGDPNVAYSISGDNLGPGKVKRYDMASISGGSLTNGWRGSAVIESGPHPVAAAVNLLTTDSPKFAGAYTGLSGGAPTWYFPSLLRNYYNWNNTLVVQNVDNTDTAITIRVFNSNGNQILTKSDSIQPNASKYYDFSTSAYGTLGSGFNGSAVVESNDGTSPIVAVLNQEAVGGFTQTFEGFTSGARTLFTPGLYNNYYFWISSINIQNIESCGGCNANVKVTYSDGKVVNKVIPPRSSALLLQFTGEGHSNGWNGGATITSNRDIVAIVNAASDFKQAQTYSGVSGGGSMIAVPLIPKKETGRISSFTVMNIDTATVTYKIHYSNGTSTGDLSLATNSSKEYYLPAVSQVPNGFGGGALIESTNGRKVAIIVNQTYENQAGGDWSMSYNGVPVTP